MRKHYTVLATMTAAALIAVFAPAPVARADVYLGNTSSSPTWTRPQVSGASLSGAIRTSATYTLAATPQSADFLAWHRQLGGASLDAVSTAVPEPITAVLLLGVTTVGVLARRHSHLGDGAHSPNWHKFSDNSPARLVWRCGRHRMDCRLRVTNHAVSRFGRQDKGQLGRRPGGSLTGKPTRQHASERADASAFLLRSRSNVGRRCKACSELLKITDQQPTTKLPVEVT